MSSLISGFHHVCLKTRDWDRTMAVYRDVLGCTEKITWRKEPERAAMLDTGDGNYIEVFEDLAYTPAPNGSIYHFAFRTARLDEAVDGGAPEGGGPVVQGVQRQHPGGGRGLGSGTFLL